MTTVVCVIGLPGSGKTTFCEYLVSSREFHDSLCALLDIPYIDIMHLNFDLTEHFDPEAWRSARRTIHEQVRCMRENVSKPTLVLLDDVFQYKSMRKQFRPSGTIYMNTTLADCLENNSKRKEKIPNDVIHKMARTFEPPKKCLYGNALIFDSEFWRSVFSPVVPEVTLSRHEVVLNIFEKKLRNLVSKKQCNSQEISDAKRLAMQRFKANTSESIDMHVALFQLVLDNM